MPCDVMSVKIYDQSTLPAMAEAGKESGDERNIKNQISRERKELFR